MKEDFPNLAKEIDFQEIQEAQRVLKKLNPKKNILRHIIITLPKLIDKERFLKASREPWLVWLSGWSMGLQMERSWVQFPVRVYA